MVDASSGQPDPTADDDLLLTAGYHPGAIARWSEKERARRVEQLRIPVQDLVEDEDIWEDPPLSRASSFSRSGRCVTPERIPERFWRSPRWRQAMSGALCII